jgi:hypothetical protein
MANTIDWIKYHQFMPKEGYCGQTTVRMVLSACGIKKSIQEISKHIYKEWYGSPYILIVAYLNKFFSTVNYKTGATISDISAHLKLGHILIINFWDRAEDGTEDGHYAIVSDYNNKVLTIVDSSKERDWEYGITAKEFNRIWYDTLVNDNSLWHENLLIWVDPKSKRTK